MAHVFAVLRGGPSPDHTASLQSGQVVLDTLFQRPGTHKDIYIDRNGIWHDRGRPVNPEHCLRLVDVVFNALHGEYGEDGTVQRVLEQYHIPFTGSHNLSAFLASHKALAKEIALEEHIPTPKYILHEAEDNMEESIAAAIRSLGLPLAVKSVFGEGSHYVRIASTKDEALYALNELSPHGPVLLEEYITGKEISLFIVEGFRGVPFYTFPAVEVLYRNNEWMSECPGNVTKEEYEILSTTAQKIFSTLQLRHYAKIDFILTPHIIYFLEANALPKLHKKSLFTKALASVGAQHDEFIDHLEGLALRG